METQELISQVKRIEISTKRLVEGLISGSYHSIFRGQGIEFSEIREYSFGDDIRAIDWKVTARLNKPFIKEFIEERDLRVYFAFDASASSAFGSNVSKKNKALTLTAALMFSAMRNNDNCGLIVFTDKAERFMPARKGRTHVLKILSELLSYHPGSDKTDLANAISFMSKVIKRKSIIFIISDFLTGDFSKQLRILSQRHDVVAIRVNDPREKEMPDIGLIELEDEETGEQVLVDTSDPVFRKNYAELIKNEERKLSRALERSKVDSVAMSTEEAYDLPLRKFFRTRKKRMVR